MRYRDLVNFEPISTVIQLRDADAQNAARGLVDTYVISDRMAEQIAKVIIPQLQLDRPADNKGVLIVGNYGTGKSHLMSVISSVAEYPDLASSLTNDTARTAAAAISGRFKVIRAEIGAVSSSLRDIVTRELEDALAGWGIDYTFPPADELTNNKDALIEAVSLVSERFPNQGLLLVIDELLDFLRSRHDQQLILDLGFLRELGETAELTPFRFIGGLQETLFESPRFSFVAEQLRRVRDRFEQVVIARQDIEFVVANRLLGKTDEQLAVITDHLRQFTPLYDGMAERLQDFARLYPIHPAYVETFQNVVVAEKREVLRTFSQAVASLLDKDVPASETGLISFDHYWTILLGNPSMKTYPEVSEVLEKGTVLDRLVSQNFGRPQLAPIAHRIIHALGVHRLTTTDINAPVGITPERLRDDLCLYVKTPEDSADFLLGQVQVALKEITRAVSGQYISHNDGNDQYYLDVKKDVDFDARIQERGDALDDNELNRYFFDSLRESLELDSSTYVTGHQIRFYELPWESHKVNRPGYLFFGAPDERSTAQPPRDFYIYLLPPRLERQWHDEQRSDEVIFSLTGLDDAFDSTLRRYAGARALENESATHRDVYSGKARDHRRTLARWIDEHLVEHLEVRHQGIGQHASAILPRTRSSASATISDYFRIVASTLLAPHFEDSYPEYPAFSRLQQSMAEGARASNANEAIATIGGRRTNLGLMILDGLKLLGPENTIDPSGSNYARSLLKRLHEKPEGQVVNRGEVIEVVAGGIAAPVEKDIEHRLEPEWIAVVLAALVHHGDISLTLNGKEAIDASTVDRLTTTHVESLVNFQHFARPRELPMKTWVSIFERLGLLPALVKDESRRDEAVRALQVTIQQELARVATLQQSLSQRLSLWNEPVFTENFTLEAEGGAVVGIVEQGERLLPNTINTAIRQYRKFLEELQKFNTPGKLRNIKVSQGEAIASLGERAAIERGERLIALVQRLQPLATYLATAQGNMLTSHEWSQRSEQVRREIIDTVRRIGRGDAAFDVEPTIVGTLADMKQDYVRLYAQLHRDAVLNAAGDERRSAIYRDQRIQALKTLEKLDLLATDKSKFAGWSQAITAIPTCREFHEGQISQQPTCPSCGFRPSQRQVSMPASELLAQLDERLTDMLVNWRKAVRANLESPPAQTSIANMTTSERAPIDAFLGQQDDDPSVPAGIDKAATTALRGLSALSISVDNLVHALEDGGLPCTVDDFRKRFEAFIVETMRGYDRNGTRLTLEQAAPLLAAAD